MPIRTQQVLHKRGEPISEVFFLNGGVASLTTAMRDGSMVEIATVGDEGVVGITAANGGRQTNAEARIQIPDTDAIAMPIDAFRSELARGGALHDAVSRYSEGLFALMMQSTACMALHPVPERCSRWLLLAHDRVRRDEFELSQEFLAMMLGASRPTVSIAAGALQQAGLIRYRYGKISILDRPGLEAGACECYDVVKQQFDRLGL